MSKARQTITHVGVERLTGHPANIRDDLGDLSELAASIREHGILQPLTCTEHIGHGEQLLLLAGHRRLGAALLAGVNFVPVIIRHDVTDESEHLVIMLVDLDEESLAEVRSGRLNSTDAIAVVRDTRQEHRASNGVALRGRPKASTGPGGAWFSPQHRLAAIVRATCTHVERRKVGSVGCGPCWETAIRDEQGGGRDVEIQPVHEVDQVVVERFIAGEHDVRTNPAEKVAIVARWRELGRPLKQLEDLGWQPYRYYGPDRDEVSA